MQRSPAISDRASTVNLRSKVPCLIQTELEREHLLQTVGENDTRTRTKNRPKIISSSGHQRSNQDSDSVDELISTFSFYSPPNPNREPRPCSIGSSLLLLRGQSLDGHSSAFTDRKIEPFHTQLLTLLLSLRPGKSRRSPANPGRASALKSRPKSARMSLSLKTLRTLE